MKHNSGMLVAVLVLLPVVAEARQVLTYASSLPPAHPSSIGIQYFADQVAAETGGEITIDFFPSGSAASAKTMLSAVSKGLVDGGFIANIYYPGELPVTSIISDLSFSNAGSLAMSAVITDTVLNDCPACLAEFEKIGIHFLSSYGTPPYKSMCSKIESATDPAGRRLRVAGEEMGHWAERIGGIPINIPNNEAYEAMQRGQIDCVIGSTAWMTSLSLGELTAGVLDLPMGAFQGGSLINVSTRFWATLDDNRKGMLSRIALASVARTVFTYQEQEIAADALMAEKGIALVAPSEALIAARKDYQEAQIQMAVESAAARGFEGGQAVADALLANLAKWTALLEGKTVDEAGYRDLLIAEILEK